MARRAPTLKQLRNKTIKTGDRDHLPLPTGRYPKVGFRDILVGYSRKSGVLLRLYYPHSKDAEHNALLWPNWLPHPAYKQGMIDVGNIKSRLLIRILERFNKENVFLPALPNVKVAREENGGKFPAVVFSHGLGGFRNVNAGLCIELASHGFVVAAVEHRDNSACLSFYAGKARYSFKNSNPDFHQDQVDGENGDVVDADDEVDFGDELDDPNYVPPKALDPMSSSASHLELKWIRHRYYHLFSTSQEAYNFRNKQVHHRVRECSRALDVLEAFNAGFPIHNLLDPGMNVRDFEALIDMDKVSVMGHSFGGATALMSGAAELRFKVIVALDAWTFPVRDEAFDMITQPTIMLNTETFMLDKANRRKLGEMMNIVEGDDPERRRAWTLNGAAHFQQCDVPFVLSGLSMLASGLPLSWHKMSNFTVHDLTARLSMQFIAKFLDIDLDKDIAQYNEDLKNRYRTSKCK